MAGTPLPAMKMGPMFTAHCRLPTIFTITMKTRWKIFIVALIAIPVMLVVIGAATIDRWQTPLICRIAGILLDADVQARSIRMKWKPETILQTEGLRILLRDGQRFEIEQLETRLTGNFRDGFRPAHTRIEGVGIEWNGISDVSKASGHAPSGKDIEETVKQVLSELPRFGNWEIRNVHLSGLLPPHTIALKEVYVGPSLSDDRFILQLFGSIDGTDPAVPVSMEALLGMSSPFPIDAAIRAQGIDLHRLPIPTEILSGWSGTSEMELTLSGNIEAPIGVNASIHARNAGFRLKTTRSEKRYEFPSATATVSAALRMNEGIQAAIAFDVLNTTLLAKLRVQWPNGIPEALRLQIETPWMDVRTYQAIFPAPLLPLWISQDIVDRFQEGAVKIETFALEGTPEQLANLAAKGNEHVLRFRARYTGIGAQFDALPYPVSDLQAVVAIENGALTIEDASANISRSTLKQGSYRIQHLYTDKPEDRLMVDATIDLADLAVFRRQPWFTASLPPVVNAIGQVSGTAAVQASIEHLLQPRRLRLSKVDVALRKTILTHDDLPEPVSIREAEMSLLNSDRLRVTASGGIGTSEIRLSGEGSLSEMTGQAHVVGDIDASRLSTWIDPDKRWIETLSGRIRSDVHAAVSSAGVHVTGLLHLDSWNLETPDIVLRPTEEAPVISFDVDLRPDLSFRVNRFALQAGKDTISVVADWASPNQLPERIHVQTERFDAGYLGLRFTAFDVPLSGMFTFDTAFSPLSQPPYFDHAWGRIAIENLGGALGNQCLPIDIQELSVHFDGERVDIHPLLLRIGGDVVDISGTVEGLHPLNGRISIDAPQLNFARMAASWNCPQAESSGVGWVPGFLRVRLHADRLFGKAMSFGPFDADFAIGSQGLLLDEALLRTSTGYMRWKGARSNDPEYTDFVGYLYMTHQDVASLLREFGWDASRIHGFLTLDGLVRLKATDIRSWKTGIQGSASVLLENGHILGSNPFLTIFSLLSVQNLIRLKSPELVKDRFPFDRMIGEITADSGSISLKGFRMDSPVFNAVGTGTLQLDSFRLDADIGAHPLTAIDEIVSNIPYVGYVLTGDEKALWEYSFAASGVLPDISIHYKPLSNVPNSVWGYLKRSLKLPQAIFSSLFGGKPVEPSAALGKTEREVQYEQEKILSPFDVHAMEND